jgi:hypothetical protein
MAQGCRVEQIDGLQRSEDRALAFLICPDDPDVDAKEVFESLPEDKKRLVRDRFDYWLQHGRHNPYFHGWDNDPYKNCFVFKWKQNRQHQRLYGFLIHPCPKTDKRIEVCVLASHAPKNTEETDPAELNGVLQLSQRVDVISAVKATFPDVRKDKR